MNLSERLSYNAPDIESSTGDLPPGYEQAINFALVHAITRHASGVITFHGMLDLQSALRNAPEGWPDFDAMAHLRPPNPDNTNHIVMSPPYRSRPARKSETGEIQTDHWAVLPTPNDNPFHLMHLTRTIGYRRPLHPAGFYVAEPKQGGSIVYFAVIPNEMRHPENRFQVQLLNDEITYALMCEIELAATVLYDDKPVNFLEADSDSFLEAIMSNYPHPSQIF